jgi:ferredoxin
VVEIKKNPLNVSGKYYVCQETCLDHELCVEEAPNNFRMDESSFALTFSNSQELEKKN